MSITAVAKPAYPSRLPDIDRLLVLLVAELEAADALYDVLARKGTVEEVEPALTSWLAAVRKRRQHRRANEVKAHE